MDEQEYQKLIDIITKIVHQEILSREKKKLISEFSIPVEISNRHVHLSRESLDILFGEGYELTKIRDLSQPGEFACQEQVIIVSKKMKVIEKVRVVGPTRNYTQAELSITDGYYLGLDLPTRISGDIKGSPPLIFIGPKGVLDLPEGAIRAARHIHMTPEDALMFRVTKGDRVKVEVSGDHSVIYQDVVIRISEKSKLAFHIDTDEANAANIKGVNFARIL
ncbi:MAG: phosphate propanoyltransferase [Candidatus Caldatribacteriota bacterium]